MRNSRLTVGPYDIDALNARLLHTLLGDMPDSTGVVTDHDTRLVAKVQDDTPTVPAPFKGMLWLDTNAVATVGVKSFQIKSTAYTLALTDEVIECTATLTLTLPDPTDTDYAGKVYYIYVNGDYIVTFSRTINGEATFSLRDGEAISVINNGSVWRMFA